MQFVFLKRAKGTERYFENHAKKRPKTYHFADYA